MRGARHVPAEPARVARPRTAFDVATQWSEPPLLIAPPDHAQLTAEEHEVEEQHRCDLYSAIAARCQSEMHKVEVDVREFRRQKGYGALDDEHS